jgi:hypothetical protein
MKKLKEDAVPANAMSAAIAGPHSDSSMPLAPKLGMLSRRTEANIKAARLIRQRKRGK